MICQSQRTMKHRPCPQKVSNTVSHLGAPQSLSCSHFWSCDMSDLPDFNFFSQGVAILIAIFTYFLPIVKSHRFRGHDFEPAALRIGVW